MHEFQKHVLGDVWYVAPMPQVRVNGSSTQRDSVRGDERLLFAASKITIRLLVRSLQNRSTLFPASAPTAVTVAIAIEYQVATNSGESSMHWEAYSVAAHPADSNPANAPATAGREGAP